jgi:hypothetical protein
MDIDEPGRDNEAFRVDLAAGATRRLADRHDPVTYDGDVGFERFGAGSVDDETASKQQIELEAHSILQAYIAVGYFG